MTINEIPTDLLTRRSMLKLSAAASAVFVAGCSSAAKSGGSGGGSGQSSKSTTLVIGTTTDFDPPDILRAGTNTTTLGLVFDSMAVIDPQTLAPRPSVATGWSWNADKTELTVNLRSDVRYHTGRAFGPKDAIFSIKAVQDPKAGAQIAGVASQIKSMTVSGAHQIKLTLKRPVGSFLDLLMMTPLVDSATFKGLFSGKQVIGTGPFVFGDWTPGTSVTLHRNPRYWQSNLPHLDNVRVRIFGSEQALVSALRANEVGLAWNLVPSDASLLAKGGAYPSVTTAPLFSEWYVGANVKSPPFDDVRVRRAVAHALDRERIVKQAFAGFGTASCCPWPTSLPGLSASDDTYYTYDPGKAKALLKQAGGPPSQTFSVVIGAGNAIAEAILNIVQYNLSAIGLNVKAQQVQNTAFQQQLQKASIPGLWVNAVGQVDLSIGAVLLGNAPFKITENTSNVTDPRYVALANRLIYASSSAEIASATAGVTDYVLQQAWHMTVGHVPTTSARVPGLSGATSNAGLSLQLTSAKLS
jgi:peptide/nickel transport system substrate-binding protein